MLQFPLNKRKGQDSGPGIAIKQAFNFSIDQGKGFPMKKSKHTEGT